MEYASNEWTTTGVEECDQQMLVPFLMKALKDLDPKCVKKILPLTPNLDDYLWKSVTFIEEADLSLVKTNLSLYHKKITNDNDVKSPLVWWKYHEKKS
jgi:hypothetical protein